MKSTSPDEKRVLCIDDAAFLDLLATSLEAEDETIDTVTTTSPGVGLETLAEQRIDCIVCEYDMGEMAGIELLQIVRDDHGDVPFILFTGNEDVASEALSAGASDYLKKTPGTDQYAVLANRIETHVRLHRAETRLDQSSDQSPDASAVAAPDPGDEPSSTTDLHDELSRERRQAFDALAEASADGIIMLDDDSTIRYANPAVERILGYPREELVGSSQMKIIPERLRQTHADAFQRYLETGAKHIDWNYVELPGSHRDGHEIPLAISFSDFEHDGDHYFVGTFRDISKRKAVEAKLQRQNERLENFASIVSHDLRGPLNVVRGYLELLESDHPEEQKIEAALSAVGRIESIVADTLTLAREGEVVDEDAIERVSLAEQAEQSWQTIETTGASLHLDTTFELSADPERLRHVFENLFRNAIQHGTAPVSVRVGDLPEDDGFYVADDGPGIPEEKRDSVFDGGYTTATDGNGLGLSIVEGIAEAHGWTVSLTESEDGGARFEFAATQESKRPASSV